MSDLRSQLNSIYEQHGYLTADLVVEEARDKKHPLHPRIFDKTKVEAAEAYYLNRADELIRSVRITRNLKGGPTRFRQYSPVRPDQPGVFDSFEDIEQDPIKYAVLLQTMSREWRSMKATYDHLAEFWEMIKKDAAA